MAAVNVIPTHVFKYGAKWEKQSTDVIQCLRDLHAKPNSADSLHDLKLVSCNGQVVEVHKLLLYAASDYLTKVLKGHYAVSGEWPTELKFGHASFEDLKNVTDFMYNGQVEVRGRDLDGFLQLAHSIQLKGFPVPGSAEQGLNGTLGVFVVVQNEDEVQVQQRDGGESGRRVALAPPVNVEGQEVRENDGADETVEILEVTGSSMVAMDDSQDDKDDDDVQIISPSSVKRNEDEAIQDTDQGRKRLFTKNLKISTPRKTVRNISNTAWMDTNRLLWAVEKKERESEKGRQGLRFPYAKNSKGICNICRRQVSARIKCETCNQFVCSGRECFKRRLSGLGQYLPNTCFVCS